MRLITRLRDVRSFSDLRSWYKWNIDYKLFLALNLVTFIISAVVFLLSVITAIQKITAEDALDKANKRLELYEKRYQGQEKAPDTEIE